MADPHGSFVWYELLTSDPDAAARFYGAVVGWTASPFDGPVKGYFIFEAADGGIAGLMKPPEAADGLAPAWYGYVGVDDVDDAVRRLEDGGGSVLMPASDLSGIGRMAMVRDPQGIAFYVMRGTGGMESVSFDAEKPGHCAWNELVTTDQAAALRLYPALFGWQPGDTMPMPGNEGGYRFLGHGEAMIGAVMNRMGEHQPTGWNFYFRVPGIAPAVEAVKAHGGTILFGPQEVPGGDHVVSALDPQGARFGLVGAPG